MIHETYECDRCNRKEPQPEAARKNWAANWQAFEIAVPVPPRQAMKGLKVLCCPACADFLEALLSRIVSDASKDAVLAALFKP